MARARVEPALNSNAPRISVQQGFEEQFDACRSDGWTRADYDDCAWPRATVLCAALDGPHQNLEPRGIPFLTQEMMVPQRYLGAERVRSLPHRFTIYAKPYLAPGDLSSNFMLFHAYLATQIWSPRACEVRFVFPHKQPGALKVNGQLAQGTRPQTRRPIGRVWSAKSAWRSRHYAPVGTTF